MSPQKGTNGTFYDENSQITAQGSWGNDGKDKGKKTLPWARKTGGKQKGMETLPEGADGTDGKRNWATTPPKGAGDTGGKRNGDITPPEGAGEPWDPEGEGKQGPWTAHKKRSPTV